MSNIKVKGLYIYQPKPADQEYIYGIGNIPYHMNTELYGLTKYEAERILLLLNETRGLDININTLRKMECDK